MSAAAAAEEGKRRDALARQAAEAGETEWVLDFSGASILPEQSTPLVVEAGSLDGNDMQKANYAGRRSYGKLKEEQEVRPFFFFCPYSIYYYTLYAYCNSTDKNVG